MKHCVFLLGIILASASGSVFSAAYSQYGAVSGISSSIWNGKTGNDADSTADFTFHADGNHRLSFTSWELFLHHVLNATDNAGTDTEWNYTVYEAFLRFFPVPVLSASAGRQRWSWGNGLLFSVSDSFQPNAFEASSGRILETQAENTEQSGFSGAGIGFYPTSDLSIQYGVDCRKALDDRHFSAGTLRTGFLLTGTSGPFDFFLSAVYGKNKTLRPGAGGSVDIAGLLFRIESAVEFGTSVERPVRSPDGTAYLDTDGSPLPMVSGGVEKDLYWDSFSFFLRTEYLFLAGGYTKNEQQLLADHPELAIAALSDRPSVLPDLYGTQYGTLAAEFELEDTWTIETLAVVDLTGPGVLVSNSVTWLGFGNITIKGSLLWHTGAPETEFAATDTELSENENAGRYRFSLEVQYSF